ncbi:MAG TPA: FAD/NAD(P)-binding protein [Acidimicrobiia bacterium]|nr:FAD/NAD(P)-binding protein [Acidimicrobiia bacterium]
MSFDNLPSFAFPRLRLERPTVAIVGGGASGVLTAVHLLRRRAPVRIVLVEERARLGRGIAYGTSCDAHLLNVPAAGMSAFPEEPGHFLHWARARHPEAHAGSFLPRRLYGEYLEWCLDEEIAGARRRTPFTAIEGRVTGIATGPGGAGLRLADGETLWASQVVLALGNSPAPANAPASPAGPGPVRDAWQRDAIADLPSGRPVVLVGTGLTAVDIIVSLEETGFDGAIHAVSRRGLLPQPHRREPSGYAPEPSSSSRAVGPPAGAPTPVRARDLVAAVRAEVRLAAALGHDWRSVVDGLRPLTQALWEGLPEGERARLQRHALRYWEVHRHRMAPEIAERIEGLRRSGRLQISAGRIVSVMPTPGGVAVTVRPRGGRAAGTASSSVEMVLRAGAVIRCTGPREDLDSVGDPLLDGLFAGGDIGPGPLGLGLAVDADGRLLDRMGEPSDTLWALGPLRRGALLETTAIPEIRQQAAALAQLLPTAAMAVEVGYALEEAL